MKLLCLMSAIYFVNQFMLRKCQSVEDIITESNRDEQASAEVNFKQTEKDFDLEHLLLYSKNNEENIDGALEKLADYSKQVLVNKQYEKEKLAGDPADTFGINKHHYYPTMFKNYGRRFVVQYPYEEKLKKEPFHAEDLKLLPIKASPELVLSVAMRSALEEADQPSNSLDDNEMNLLRSGDYWDSVWVEEVNPKKILRSFQEKTGYNLEDSTSKRIPKLNSLKAKIMPGSKLYQLVSVLKKSSPRLLYVISNNQNKD